MTPSQRLFEKSSDALLLRRLDLARQFSVGGKQGLCNVYVHGAVVTGGEGVVVTHVFNAADEAA